MYEIVAMPGETNRLPLLIGPKYAVSCEAAFGSFGLVPPPFVPLADDTGTVARLSFGDAFSATNVTDRLVEVRWPVEKERRENPLKYDREAENARLKRLIERAKKKRQRIQVIPEAK